VEENIMVKLVETENGQYKIYYTYSTGSEAKERILNKMFALSKSADTRTFWWRATNNKNEHEICGEIHSKNHADGTIEKGMSVSESVAYQYFNGFKYIYAVTGDVIGTGSDGEPLLKNAIALTKSAQNPSARYLKKEKHFNQLSPELDKLMVNMLNGVELVQGNFNNEREVLSA
jgi:hypothetical protein